MTDISKIFHYRTLQFENDSQKTFRVILLFPSLFFSELLQNNDILVFYDFFLLREKPLLFTFLGY